MDEEAEKSKRNAILRRLVYMVVAILAAALLPIRPALHFQEDKGIIYVRSFSMDQKALVMTQTALDTGVVANTESMSVKGLYYCYKIMLWGTILCFLCFFKVSWRIVICDVVALAVGVYYVLIVIYAMRIADAYFATFYPDVIAMLLPALVLQGMILTRHSAIQSRMDEADDMEENIPQ